MPGAAGFLSPELQSEYERLQAQGRIPSAAGPQVFLGTGQRRPQTTAELTGGTPLDEQDRTASIDSKLQELFTMADSQPTELQNLQTRLFRAGFYGSTKPSRIGWGQPDELTVQAYETALRRSAAFYEAGVKKTPEEVIDEAVRTRQQQDTLGLAGEAGIIGGGNVYVVNTDDPAALRQLADRVGQAVIGKKPDDELRQQIVSSIIEEQETQQQAVISAREGAERAIFGARVNQQGQEGQMVVGAGAQVSAPEGGMSPQQIAQVAHNAGFRGEALQTAVAISLAESSGHPGAHNPRGEDSRGLWQINVDAHGSRFGDPQQLFDPQANAAAAFQLWKESGFRPWTTFTGATQAGAQNSHTRFMDVAARAAASVQQQGANDLRAGRPLGGSQDVEAAGAAPTRQAPSPSNQFIPPQTVSQVGVDPQARAIEQTRAARPAEAQATDIANTYNDFLQVILGGIGGQT